MKLIDLLPKYNFNKKTLLANFSYRLESNLWLHTSISVESRDYAHAIAVLLSLNSTFVVIATMFGVGIVYPMKLIRIIVLTVLRI